MNYPFITFIKLKENNLWPCLIFENVNQLYNYKILFQGNKGKEIYEDCCGEIVDKGLDLLSQHCLDETKVVYLFGKNENGYVKYIDSYEEEIHSFEHNYQRIISNTTSKDLSLLNAIQECLNFSKKNLRMKHGKMK